jgi:hypothetical protein
MDEQFQAELTAGAIAKFDHLPELESRIDVEERKWQWRGSERFLRQPQQDGRVFADRIKHRGPRELGGHFADDLNALRLEVNAGAKVETAPGPSTATCAGFHQRSLLSHREAFSAVKQRPQPLAYG